MTTRTLIPAILVAMSVSLSGCELSQNGTVTLAEADSPFIALNIWVKAGSQNDPEGKEGLAALTADLLADGSTTENTYEEILAQLYPMAAGYGSRVDKEMTVFTGRVHRDNLESYYTLFGNALLKPAFSEDDFERIKTQTLNYLERSRRYGRDEELSKELLFWMAYRGTPYEHPEEGYVESVRAITLDDVRSFYETYYVANNMVVGLGGGYPDGFAARARADIDALREGVFTPVPAPVPERPEGIHVLIVEKPTDASAISIGFPTDLLRGAGDFHEMMVMNSWFGEHRNSFSHLYQVIRESRGMNYGDYSYIEAFPLGFTTQQPPVNVGRRSQLFEIWIRPISSTEPGNLHDRTLFATRAALRELHTLVDDGMSEDAVDDTKQFLRNYSVNWGNTIGRRLAYAVDDAFYGLRGGYLAGIRPGIEPLDADAVNTAIGRYLQYDNLYLVFITADAEAFKQKLLSGEPTPITYAGERTAEHMAEDELIASFPIPVEEANITIMGINDVFERGN
jgi:zinc protease